MLVKFCNQVVTPLPLPLQATASQHERKIIPIDNQNFRYLRFRAIGNMEVSGPNGNNDCFPYQHFEDKRPGYGYQSFINKRAHVEHNSATGLAGSIGDLPDAYLNRFDYANLLPSELFVTAGDLRAGEIWRVLAGANYASVRKAILEAPNQKDGAIEVLMRIDTSLVKSATAEAKTKQLLDRIIRMIDTGQKLTCSMGTNILYSVCSSCGNIAHFASEYCPHMKPQRKGSMSIVQSNQIRDLLDKDLLRPEWLKHIIKSNFDVNEVLQSYSNKGVAVKNVEINHEVSFFELSVVAMPAFPAAVALEKLGSTVRQADETSQEWIKRLAKTMSDSDILDLYAVLQERGLISNACQIA